MKSYIWLLSFFLISCNNYKQFEIKESKIVLGRWICEEGGYIEFFKDGKFKLVNVKGNLFYRDLFIFDTNYDFGNRLKYDTIRFNGHGNWQVGDNGLDVGLYFKEYNGKYKQNYISIGLPVLEDKNHQLYLKHHDTSDIWFFFKKVHTDNYDISN